MRERAWLDRVLPGLPPAPAGEVWAGDDAAVLHPPGGAAVVLTVDPMVEGVHFDLSLTSAADAGWKALARNVSDVAAMGARPWRCVASLVAPPGAPLDELHEGLVEAASHWGCPLVGGDLASGPALVVTVTLAGVLDGAPVTRAGAGAGDRLVVSGPVGRGKAGLRLLRAGERDGEAQRWYARPRPSVEAALAARAAGATAMIDVSDGLSSDLDRLAAASGVGVRLRGGDLPLAGGATVADALHGGDDYVVAYSLPAGAVVPPGHAVVGQVTADGAERSVDGHPLAAAGWEHDL